MTIERIHQVGYRFGGAKQTVDWYRKYLDIDFLRAIAEGKLPSTKAPMHAAWMHERATKGMASCWPAQ